MRWGASNDEVLAPWEGFMQRRVTLITGASVGLGLAIARRMLEKTEDHLILTARASSLDRFEQEDLSENERLWLRPLDVTSEHERQLVIWEAVEKLGGVDVLINNAGISYRAVTEHVRDEERNYQMAVNYNGPIALCRLVLPCMRAKGYGRIVQISSAGGFMAMPTMGVYTASKFALEGATEALYYEVRPFGIKVSLILPGFINSDGFERVVLTGQSNLAFDDPTDPYHPHYRYMSDFIGKIMKRALATPESVARTVVRTVNARHPKLRVPGTLDMRFLWMMRRYLPSRLYHELLYQMLPGIRHWNKQQATLLKKTPGREGAQGHLPP